MRVMVIGASKNPAKYGHKAVRAYQRQGHDVLPINPHAETVAGIRCFADVTGPPGPIDRASLYLPPSVGIGVLDALAERGDVAELWVNPGAESPQLLDRAAELGLATIQACSILAVGEDPRD